jgi:hypothetical protein
MTHEGLAPPRVYPVFIASIDLLQSSLLSSSDSYEPGLLLKATDHPY